MKRIEKACKQCNQIFIIEYDPTGSGSGNAQRKAYCSDACKKSWVKDPNNGVKIEISCFSCGKKLFFPPSHAKTRVTCSKRCYAKRISFVNTKYVNVEKSCEHCGVKFECVENSNRKYCGHDCASKSKINRVEKFCEVCEKNLIVKKSYDYVRFCSVICRRKGQSLGLVKSHTNGRTGWRSDIENSPYFKSSFEADYVRYLQHIGVKFLYEPKVFEVKIGDRNRFYTPDFYLPDSNEYIELKGVELDNNNSFSLKINTNSNARELLNNSGENIKVIYMKDFYHSLKERGLYDKIQNIENKDYAGTQHLITTYKDRLNSDSSS